MGKLLFIFLMLVSSSWAERDEVNGIDMGFQDFRPTVIPDDKAFIRPKVMYEMCAQNETTCYGVKGPNCLQEQYCEHIFAITESPDVIKWSQIDMYTFGFPLKRELVNAHLIALSPFHFDGSRYTCKSSVGSTDFRIFFYHVPTNVLRPGGGEEFRYYDWTGGFMDKKIDVPGKGWSETCANKLRSAIELLQESREERRSFNRAAPFVFLKNREIIYVLYYSVEENQGLPRDEMSKFLDINSYSSTDGVLFTNFLNEAPANKTFQMRTNTAVTLSTVWPSYVLAALSLALVTIWA